MTDEQIKYMRDRFLTWKLPRDTFNPDCGISFDKRPYNTHTPHPAQYDPSGTNLFDATQAEAMIRHMIEGLPSATLRSEMSDQRQQQPTDDEVERLRSWIRRIDAANRPGSGNFNSSIDYAVKAALRGLEAPENDMG